MSAETVTALLFEAADQRYGLDVSNILEVVPAVHLRKIPGVPEYVAGVFCYRDTIVPVLDLNQMLCGLPAVQRFSTRMILVNYSGLSATKHILGLLVERANQGLVEGLGNLLSSGIATTEAPYLGNIAIQGDDSIQLVKIEDLIPDHLRERLFVEN